MERRYEEFEVEVKPASGRWIKKKKYKGCQSQNPDDCYVACFEEMGEHYLIVETEQIIQKNQLPALYYFDSENSNLVREIQIDKNELSIFDKESGESIVVVNWVEKDCE